MIRGVAYSRRRAAACAAGICAALSAAMIHHHAARERFVGSAEIADMERDLNRQIAAKSGCEQADLEALRARVGKFRVRLGPADSWERLVRQFGKAWKADDGTRDNWDGYSVQVGTFRLKSPATADWPDIVHAVKASEDLPGVQVIGFEMKTSGDHERRFVDLVEIVVAIQTLRLAAIPATP